jgi:hypothetical protein
MPIKRYICRRPGREVVSYYYYALTAQFRDLAFSMYYTEAKYIVTFLNINYKHGCFSAVHPCMHSRIKRLHLQRLNLYGTVCYLRINYGCVKQ